MQISSNHSISGAISYSFIPQTSSEDGGNGSENPNWIHDLLQQERHYHNRSTSKKFPCCGMNISTMSAHSKAHTLVTQHVNPLVISQHPHRPLPLALGTWSPGLLFILTAPVVFSPAVLVWFWVILLSPWMFLSTSLQSTSVLHTAYSVK